MNIFDKIWAAGNLIFDTFLTLIDISRISEDALDKKLSHREQNPSKDDFDKILENTIAEDQEQLRKVRRREGTYKINYNGTWYRDLGWAEDIIFLGRDPKQDD